MTRDQVLTNYINFIFPLLNQFNGFQKSDYGLSSNFILFSFDGGEKELYLHNLFFHHFSIFFPEFSSHENMYGNAYKILAKKLGAESVSDVNYYNVTIE